MDIQQVKDLVEYINTIAYDDERAHSMEDALHQDVLKAIAEGATNGIELATEALKTKEIEFNRWCA